MAQERIIGATGEVYYNGFTFPAQLRSKLEATYVPDDSGRTVKYVHYRLEIECEVFPDDSPTATAGDPVDTNVRSLRKKLSRYGRELRFTDQGAGTDFIINGGQGNGTTDVMFGPKPQVLSLKSIGSNRAWWLHWVVDTYIPECSEGTPRTSGLMQFNYEAEWSIDREGMTVRKINGVAEIAANRVSTASTKISDTADKYRELVTDGFPVPKGFWREQEYRLSQDKRTLRFTITDTEVPSDTPFYDKMVEIDVDHTVDAPFMNGAWTRFFNTLSGTIKVRAGVPKVFAWAAFKYLMKERVGLYNSGGKAPIPIDLSISEKVFGREVRFSISYVLNNLNINSFVNDCRLFRPISDVTWDTWRTSLEPIQNPRGFLGGKHNAGDDVILDLCSSGLSRAQTNYHPVVLPTIIQNQRYQRPTARNSWLYYDVWLVFEEDVNGAIIQRMSDQDENTLVERQGDKDDTAPDLVAGKDKASEDRNIQVWGQKAYKVYLVGRAVRVGYPIPRPKLVSVGDQKAYRMGKSRFVSKRYAGSTGIPLYFATWRIPYVLKKTPKGDTVGKAKIGGDEKEVMKAKA